MKRSSLPLKADSTRRPEAERAYLAGLLELLTDSPARCRETVTLMPPEALTIEAGPELLAAIAEAANLEAPSLADVMRIVRERAPYPAADGVEPEKVLMVTLAEASAGNRGGYARGVDRHAREVMKAAGRRRTIEAAHAVVSVAADPQAKPAEIEAAAAAVAEASAAAPTDAIDWQEFPVDLLPDPVGTFVMQAWESLDRSADPACVALPMLASVAAAIGNSRRIETRPGWSEPSVLWCAVVAESGSKKSPAADKSLAFVRERHTAALAEYRAAVAEWEREKRENDRASRRRDADSTPLSDRPLEVRYLVNDITVESLAGKLEHNASVLLERDEISGWVSSFDRYSNGKSGGDVSQWLPCYNAAPWTVDRKTSGTIVIPAAAVSIFGGIQPKVLVRSFGPHVDNGLLQRFILAAPPEGQPQWPDGDVDFATTAAMNGLFDTLFSLRPDATGKPRVLDLDPDALDAFKEWWLEIGKQRQKTAGPTKSMLSKAEAWAARLALVCHLIRQAGAEPALGNRIDVDSIRRGIGLARWAAREWRRVFHSMTAGAALEDDAALRQWIAARGGVATARDVARGLAKYRGPRQAEAALQRLTRSGAAEWQASPTGGRPADAVRLK